MESAIYIVATPIGNLADITIRAIEVLRNVDIIAAEDTRHTRKLLDHYGITTRLTSFHEHNESEKALFILSEVKAGKSIALVSDAGTPLISDPGHVLVSMAKTENVKVVPLPGPSALIAALSSGGLSCGRFVFEGFLPVKAKAKQACLEALRYEPRTIVFYESPHRIVSTLEILAEIYPLRRMVIARELTKRFETITQGTAEVLVEWTHQNQEQQKGEFVLLLAGSTEPSLDVNRVEQDALLSKLLALLPPKKAVQIVCETFNLDKKEMYDRAVAMKQG